MQKLLAVMHLDNPASLKRFVVMVFSTLLVVLSPLLTKYGLPAPTDVQLEVFAGIVVTYLLQSGYGSVAAAKIEGAKAAEEVKTTAEADAVLKEASKS